MAISDYASVCLSLGFIIDVAVGVFLIAVSIDASFTTTSTTSGLTTKSFPHIMLGLCLVAIGGLAALTGLARFPFVDVYAKALHRFGGKAALYSVGAAMVFALEPGVALTWRGIVAIVLLAVAGAYVIASFASGQTHPRPFVYCGEPKSDTPTPFAAAAPSPSAATAGGRPASRAPAAKADNPFTTSPVPSAWPTQ